MRKWNGILSGAILVLFLIHGILGGFQLLGSGSVISHALSWILTGLIGIHTVIGIVLTVRTIRIQKKTGAGYLRENALFWARRISGFAIMVLIFFHVTAFSDQQGMYFRLKWFDRAKLVTQILLVAAIALHVITNVRPMLITFGISGLRKRYGDILFVLSVLMLFMAAAFIVYFLRWNGI